MGFFTTRERAALGKSSELRGQGEVRELVRHDFVPPRRRPSERERDLTGHVGTLMKRMAEDTLREVDDLIAKLKRRREQLLAESERVQRQIVEYAQMSQSTMQSTKIISESLASFKVPDAPRMSEPHADDMSSEEPRDDEADIETERDSVAESFGTDFEQEFAQKLAQEFPRDREDDRASDGEAEAPPVRGGPRSEAT